jgi:hypothetical protein
MVIALTWAGTQFGWLSVQVVVPLAAGLVGLGAFLTYEALYPQYPIVRPLFYGQFLGSDMSLGSDYAHREPDCHQRISSKFRQRCGLVCNIMYARTFHCATEN